jgi:hypothetical protein
MTHVPTGEKWLPAQDNEISCTFTLQPIEEDLVPRFVGFQLVLIQGGPRRRGLKIERLATKYVSQHQQVIVRCMFDIQAEMTTEYDIARYLKEEPAPSCLS